MGSDGHIRFYDQGKVDRILQEINHKYNLKGDHKMKYPGYKCDFRINGQPCYIVYWTCGCAKKDMNSWHDWDFSFNKEELRILKEFEDRCNAEAILVEDQEIWT